VQVCGVRSGRAILLTSAAAGIAIGIELHLARQIWLWLRTTRVKAVMTRTAEGGREQLFSRCTVVARLLPEVSTSGLRMRDDASMDGIHLAFKGFDRRCGRKRESHPDLGLF